MREQKLLPGLHHRAIITYAQRAPRSRDSIMVEEVTVLSGCALDADVPWDREKAATALTIAATLMRTKELRYRSLSIHRLIQLVLVRSNV